VARPASPARLGARPQQRPTKLSNPRRTTRLEDEWAHDMEASFVRYMRRFEVPERAAPPSVSRDSCHNTALKVRFRDLSASLTKDPRPFHDSASSRLNLVACEAKRQLSRRAHRALTRFARLTHSAIVTRAVAARRGVSSVSGWVVVRFDFGP
jgi:hypothetical protein